MWLLQELFPAHSRNKRQQAREPAFLPLCIPSGPLITTRPPVKINYQSVGSGAGLRQIEAKTVDFGASDAPLKDEDLNKKGLVQFPTVIGGVVPVVNIKGIAPGQIKLSGQVLGDIYLGKISNWSDPAIKALNPGVALPDASIAPVRRADGSRHQLHLHELPEQGKR